MVRMETSVPTSVRLRLKWSAKRGRSGGRKDPYTSTVP
jgi:hypothetical protein